MPHAGRAGRRPGGHHLKGLGTPEDPHPLQEAFVEHGAIQCGFCTSGMVLAAKALARREPRSHPRRDQGRHLRQPLPVHRLHQDRRRHRGCRQRAPARGRAAVMTIETEGAGRKTTERPVPARTCRRPTTRSSGGACRGTTPATRCSARRSTPTTTPWTGMLHAKVLRSQYAAARIVSIDTSAAEAMPGVHAVLTAKDVPCNETTSKFGQTHTAGRLRGPVPGPGRQEGALHGRGRGARRGRDPRAGREGSLPRPSRSSTSRCRACSTLARR